MSYGWSRLSRTQTYEVGASETDGTFAAQATFPLQKPRVRARCRRNPELKILSTPPNPSIPSNSLIPIQIKSPRNGGFTPRNLSHWYQDSKLVGADIRFPKAARKGTPPDKMPAEEISYDVSPLKGIFCRGISRTPPLFS